MANTKVTIDVLALADFDNHINAMYRAWDAAIDSDDAAEIAELDRECRQHAGYVLEIARTCKLDLLRVRTLYNGHSAIIERILADARAVFS